MEPSDLKRPYYVVYDKVNQEEYYFSEKSDVENRMDAIVRAQSLMHRTEIKNQNKYLLPVQVQHYFVLDGKNESEVVEWN